MSTPESRVPIALLSQIGESSRHIREALASAGTPIVYEANAAELDRDALDASGARVVVVNLDGDVDAQLDEVYALLGDDQYNVIFNEAQVSVQLSGWEQARWARHLASKILGAGNAEPPRPADAEPVPVPVRAAPAVEVEVAAPAEPVALDLAAIEAEPPAPAAEIDLAGFGSEPPLAPPADFPEPDAVSAPAPESVSVEELPAIPPTPEIAPLDVPAPVEDFAAEFLLDEAPPVPAADFSFDVELTEVEVGVVEATPVADLPPTWESADAEAAPAASDATDIEALGFGDLDDFAGGDDATGIDVPAAPPAPEVALDTAADLAAAAPESDRAVATGDLDALELLDLDWADAPAPPAREDEPVAEVTAPPVSHEAFSWTLSDVEEGDAAAPPPSAADAKADFGIETISAAEYLAPEAEATPAAAAEDAGGFSLELVPLEEAVAPQAHTSAAAHENWMDSSAARIAVRKVIVLGASIGGPEAVREFLARIPRDYPALFLLAQHMGAEFVDLMAQQIAKSTSLTVRIPSHGERVGHGDIVIVPIDRRLRVDGEGVVVLEPLAEPQAAHAPSIDLLLADVADRFGARATAVVFSGMAEDAAEGSRQLVARGGRVYVQDPETCVISSMVDGVLGTGVVSFTGSPHELAERVLEERAAPPART